MKRAIIVHCWGGYPEYCWYPYVKKELEKQGFEVIVPAFPETEDPKLDKWLPVLKKTVGEPTEEMCLIGHSVGCITIMRYLESLPENKKVGGVVMVAGYTNDLGMEELKNFFTADINFDHIKKRANNFTAIHSDDDPYVSLEQGEIFKNKLNAELIIKHHKKHFSGHIDNEENCVELPEVVKGVLKST